MLDEQPWDRFFRGPALSFSAQDNFRDLLDQLSVTDSVTFLTGAGISQDSGLPGWDSLVSRIVSLGGDDMDRWTPFVLEDLGDPSRKAEYVLGMASGSSTRSDLVRDALYLNAPEPTPGTLCDSLARLISLRPGNVQVITTNYDTLLEAALKPYLNGNSVVRSLTLDEAKGRTPALPTLPGLHQSEIEIVHVHGILEPQQEPRGDIILAESEFLKHQVAIRDFITSQLLQSTTVVIIGMSITDPNVVGPLWAIQPKEDSKEAPGPASTTSASKSPSVFHITVVNETGFGTKHKPFGTNEWQDQATDDERALKNARAFAYRRASYLEKTFNVKNVYLKTYAQIPQLLYDAALCHESKEKYMCSDASGSIRYGYRLKRTLDTLYTRLGCPPGEDYIPHGKAAKKLSDTLNKELTKPDGIVDFLRGVASGYKGHNEPARAEIWSAAHEAFETENFGLFLWLRARVDDDHEYGLRLLGTSVYQHRNPWSLDRVAVIAPSSPFPAVQCVLSGNPSIEPMSDGRAFPLWGTIASTPFTLTGTSGSVYHPTCPGIDLDVLQVGAITLNSSNRVVPRDKLQSSSRASILPFLSNKDQAELFARLAHAAQSATKGKKAKPT